MNVGEERACTGVRKKDGRSVGKRKKGDWVERFVYVLQRCNGKSLRCQLDNDGLRRNSSISTLCPERARRLLIC